MSKLPEEVGENEDLEAKIAEEYHASRCFKSVRIQIKLLQGTLRGLEKEVIKGWRTRTSRRILTEEVSALREEAALLEREKREREVRIRNLYRKQELSR